jgi:hypothetical protein
MDRREALKKLAVGGAVAAGGSLVLSSNLVAHAASAGPAGIIGAPLQEQNLTIFFPPRPDGNNNGKRIVLGSAQQMSAANGSPVTIWYRWFIREVNLEKPNGATLQLRNGNSPSGMVIAQGPGSNTGPPNTNYQTVSITRSDGKPMKKDGFKVELEIEAQSALAGGQYLLVRYTFEVEGTDKIQQQQIDWRVLSR